MSLQPRCPSRRPTGAGPRSPTRRPVMRSMSTSIDPPGERIGSANSICLDHTSERPGGSVSRRGLFATHQRFIPLTDAAISHDRITVGLSKEHFRDSPTVYPVDGRRPLVRNGSLNAYDGLPETG